jgi:hypothetical protein
MSNDTLALARKSLRGTDSNSLLRLYDLVNGIFNKSPLQQEREAADKALRRIARELEKRHVSL